MEELMERLRGNYLLTASVHSTFLGSFIVHFKHYVTDTNREMKMNNTSFAFQ